MTLTSTRECIVNVCLTLKRRRYELRRYELLIVGSRPESVLSDVLAIHTIEIIHKSMILIFLQFSLGLCIIQRIKKGSILKITNIY